MTNRNRLAYLPQEDIAKIHEAGVAILTDTGVRIGDPELRSRLLDNGCSQEGEVIKFSADLIQKAAGHQPKSYTLKNYDGDGVTLAPGQLVTHSSGAIPVFVDPKTRRHRPGTLEDLANASRLCGELSQLDVPCPFLSPSDAPPATNQLRQHEMLLRHSKKPIYGSGISTPAQARYLVALFDACAHDAEQARKRGIVGISPESPLHLPKDITDTLRVFADAGFMISVMTAPVAGFSSPITLAGIAAQVHAEILATAAVIYLLNPAASVLYAARACFANMKTGNSIWGLPEVGIAGAVGAQVGQYAGFLTDVYGSSSTSCTFDAQAGYEKALNVILPAMAGANMLSGMGSMASLMTGSFAQLVIDNEMYAMVRKMVSGFAVNTETLALDVIDECAADSRFIEELHTLNYVRKGEIFSPDMAFAGMYGQWEDGGCKTIDQLADTRVEQLLAQAPDRVLDDAQSREFDRIIDAAAKELA